MHTLNLGLAASDSMLGTGCSLNVAGRGVSPRYSTRAELAHSVLQATCRVTVALVAAVLAHVVFAIAHVPAVGATAPVLRGRPPVAALADSAETAVGAAVAARQSRKSKLICTVTITVPTVCRFQFFARRRRTASRRVNQFIPIRRIRQAPSA